MLASATRGLCSSAFLRVYTTQELPSAGCFQNIPYWHDLFPLLRAKTKAAKYLRGDGPCLEPRRLYLDRGLEKFMAVIQGNGYSFIVIIYWSVLEGCKGWATLVGQILEITPRKIVNNSTWEAMVSGMVPSPVFWHNVHTVDVFTSLTISLHLELRLVHFQSLSNSWS